MISFYLIICIIGVILLVIFAILGGFGADVEGGSGDVDIDLGDADVDIDLGDADVDIDLGDADVDIDLGDADADIDAGMDTGLSPLSLPIILVFITSFGAFGMVFEVFDFYWIYIPFISAVGGVVIAAAMFYVMLKIFAATQATSVVPFKKLIGMRAKVSIAIKKGKEGQIIVVRPEKGRILIGAIADENIPKDSGVQIVEVLGDIVKVKKITKTKKKQAIMK